MIVSELRNALGNLDHATLPKHLEANLGKQDIVLCSEPFNTVIVKLRDKFLDSILNLGVREALVEFDGLDPHDAEPLKAVAGILCGKLIEDPSSCLPPLVAVQKTRIPPVGDAYYPIDRSARLAATTIG